MSKLTKDLFNDCSVISLIYFIYPYLDLIPTCSFYLCLECCVPTR